MTHTLPLLLLRIGAALGALPPGLEDELFCPHLTCHQPSDLAGVPGFVGPQSVFWHCMSKEGVVTPVVAWGSAGGCHGLAPDSLDKCTAEPAKDKAMLLEAKYRRVVEGNQWACHGVLAESDHPQMHADHDISITDLKGVGQGEFAEEL